MSLEFLVSISSRTHKEFAYLGKPSKRRRPESPEVLVVLSLFFDLRLHQACRTTLAAKEGGELKKQVSQGNLGRQCGRRWYLWMWWRVVKFWYTVKLKSMRFAAKLVRKV